MKKHLIENIATIVEALERLNRLSGETMTLFVVDGAGVLLGSLTDGDVRRAILAGAGLTDRVGEICNTQCLRLHRSVGDVKVLAEARKKGIWLLPVVDGVKVTALFDRHKQRGIVPADAILMGGGLGERLRPLTANTPKPLLPVREKPIIDHNIELLRQFGITEIYVTVNYLKEQIISYFSKDEKVTCVEEPRRLGTMGSATLVDGLREDTVIVMNADLLTDIDLEAMYLKHVETEAQLTMAVISYPISVPFAIVDHAGDKVEKLKEKPTYNYYANAGIYMVRRSVIESLPRGEYADAPDVINSLTERGERVSLFKIEGKWIDIGSPDDYRLANEHS